MSQETKILTATLRKELSSMREAIEKVSSKEGGNKIVEMLLQALKGEPGYTPVKGVDYFDGKDGKKPKKGVDYFTEEEVKRFIAHVTPKRGKHYWTKEDVDFVVRSTFKLITVPKAGKDFYTQAERQKMIKEVTKTLEATLKKSVKSYSVIIEKANEAKDSIRGVGVKTITVAPRAPVSPVEGDLWVKTT